MKLSTIAGIIVGILVIYVGVQNYVDNVKLGGIISIILGIGIVLLFIYLELLRWKIQSKKELKE